MVSSGARSAALAMHQADISGKQGFGRVARHSGTATLVQHPVVDVVNPALVRPLTLDRVVRFHMGTSTGDRLAP